jgi:hypothetical protein
VISAQIYKVHATLSWLVTEVPLSVSGADAFMPEGCLEGFKRVATVELDDELKVVTYERQ